MPSKVNYTVVVRLVSHYSLGLNVSNGKEMEMDFRREKQSSYRAIARFTRGLFWREISCFAHISNLVKKTWHVSSQDLEEIWDLPERVTTPWERHWERHCPACSVGHHPNHKLIQMMPSGKRPNSSRPGQRGWEGPSSAGPHASPSLCISPVQYVTIDHTVLHTARVHTGNVFICTGLCCLFG